MQNKRQLGGRKEHMAGRFLEEKGYVVLEYNYRAKMAEVDLVCKDGSTYVFVEVKYRRDSTEGHPLEAVTAAKQRKIRQAALCFLMERNLSPDLTEIRFDVIGILDEELTHVLGAF